ncbi:MAG: hypothetical protein FWG39_02035 [Alphaproteobacteria bacterium]|nr:hypothetical protein [Alphaproteobacteria bacterium]
MRLLKKVLIVTGRIYLCSMLYALCSVCGLAANDCVQYKKNPNVAVRFPEWEKSVVRPLAPMDLLHGNVVATFAEEYSLVVEADPVPGGFCVVLSGVDASVGYTDFLVQIDSRHAPASCAYNVILEHEDLHIAAHLSVMDDFAGDIKRAVAAAANSVMPIFVSEGDGFDDALDIMQMGLYSHPDIVLMKQKIDAENAMRNKQIDMRADDRRVKKCLMD